MVLSSRCVIINKYKTNNLKQTTMKKATARPTAAQVQAETARQDRRAAAKARRQDDYRQDAGFTAIYSA